MYKDIAKNIEAFVVISPKTIVPVPTNNDYELGFIRRYFVKKINDENGFIYEVSEEKFNEYIHNPFWQGDSIKWRIRGPIEKTYKSNGELDDMGVLNSNKAAISRTKSKLKNIELYLPNLLQFYK